MCSVANTEYANTTSLTVASGHANTAGKGRPMIVLVLYGLETVQLFSSQSICAAVRSYSQVRSCWLWSGAKISDLAKYIKGQQLHCQCSRQPAMSPPIPSVMLEVGKAQVGKGSGLKLIDLRTDNRSVMDKLFTR